MTINKAVNIVSTTGDAYISLHSSSDDFYGETYEDAFTIDADGANTNVTGITFYDTQIFVKNSSYVVFDNITVTTQDLEVGSGVGVLSIRNSEYITVKNSELSTQNNGGHSTLVLADSKYCTIDNNVITGLNDNGEVGNLIYLTTYDVTVDDYENSNSYNVISNNVVTDQREDSVSYAIAISGNYNVIANNTVTTPGEAITVQWGSGRNGDESQTSEVSTIGNEYYDNVVNGGTVVIPEQSIVKGNTFDTNDTTVIETGSTVTNNTLNSVDVSGVVTLDNNTINGYLNITPIDSSANSDVQITNNEITGDIYFASGEETEVTKNVNIADNNITGDIVTGENEFTSHVTLDNITITNNNVTGEMILGQENGINQMLTDVTVTDNTVLSSGEYAITVGENAADVTITDNYLSSATRGGDDAVNVIEPSDTIIVKDNKGGAEPQTIITVADATGNYNREVDLSATITDAEGNPVTGGQVSFKLNGVTIKNDDGSTVLVDVDEYGVATLPYTIVNNVGSYAISATYTGTEEYASSRTTEDATLTVGVGTADVTIQTLTEGLKGGDTVQLTAIVADEDGVVDTGVVIFKLNGVTLKDAEGNNIQTNVTNGVATLEYTIPVDMAGKDYTLTAVYSGKNYDRAEATETLSLIKQNVTANIDPIIINQGENAEIQATLYDQNGNQIERSTKVAIKVNGKTFANTNTENGVLDEVIDTADFKNPYYNVTVIFGENSAYNQLVLETTLTVNGATDLKAVKQADDDEPIVITPDNFGDYFVDTYLSDEVEEGSTLDFQGTFANDGTNNYTMNINKRVNIISTGSNALISLNTRGSGEDGTEYVDAFTITSEGNGTTVTNISFYNTEIFVKDASNVVFDNITVTVKDQEVGNGVGILSIRNSDHVTVKNSEFTTENNGGHSTLVLADSKYCTIDNNTITGHAQEGEIGDLIYLTTYDVDVNDYAHTNDYNNITNNVITDDRAESICYAIAISGSYNIIANNTVSTPGAAITVQWGSGLRTGDEDNGKSQVVTEGNVYYGNIVDGGYVVIPEDSTVYNNTFNTVETTTIDSGSLVQENNLNSVVVSGTVDFNNNEINGDLTINPSTVEDADLQITENTITGDVIFEGEENEQTQNVRIADNTINGNIVTGENQFTSHVNIDNVTIEGNTVNGQMILGQEEGINQILTDVVVKNNTVTTSEDYAVIVGQPGIIEVVENDLSAAVGGGDDAVYVAEASDDIVVKDNYGGAEPTPTPTPSATTITVADATGEYKDHVTLTAAITDAEGNPVTGGQVVFKLNGVTIKDEDGKNVYADVVDGVASIDYLIVNSPKTYTISASYSGDDEYEASRTTEDATLTVTQAEAVLTLQPAEEGLKGGDATSFTATVTAGNELLNEGQVVFKLNGVTLKDEAGDAIKVDVVNGEATLNYTIPVDMAGKDYTLTAVYSSSNYERTETSETVTLVKQDVVADLEPIVISQGENAQVKVTLYDQDGNQLERSTKVAVKVNGKTFANTETENGVLDVTIGTADFKNPEYDLTVVLGENSAYNKAELTTTLTVE